MSDPSALKTLAIGVTAIAVLYFGPLAKLRKDDYRSDIRPMRDELFDFM